MIDRSVVEDLPIDVVLQTESGVTGKLHISRKKLDV